MKGFVFYWLPVFLWAGMIFYSSSQPYENQDIKPFLNDNIPVQWAGDVFGVVKFNYAGEEISVDALGEARFVEFFIRKGAHVSVYSILAILLIRALYRSYGRLLLSIGLSLLLSVLYAGSDEIHQGFTPNRSPHLEDVFLDVFGAIIGTVIIGFYYYKKKTE